MTLDNPPAAWVVVLPSRSLITSALAARVLDWKRELHPLAPFPVT